MIRHSVENNLYFRKVYTAETRNFIFYVHGLGESGLCFESTIQSSLLENWGHLVPDLTGYGKSPWPMQPVSLETHADLLFAWLSAQEVDSVVLLGHSMGGVVSQIFCEKYPEKVRAFVNVEGNVSFDDCTVSRQIAGYSAGVFAGKEFFNLLDTLYQDGLTNPSLRNLYPSQRFCDPKMLHANAVELVALSQAENLALRFSCLPMPKIYFAGHPGGTGGRSLATLKKAGITIEIIEKAGHWPFLEQPEKFIKGLLRFLDEL